MSARTIDFSSVFIGQAWVATLFIASGATIVMSASGSASMSTKSPNKPAAAKPAATLQLHLNSHWRGPAEPGRWAEPNV